MPFKLPKLTKSNPMASKTKTSTVATTAYVEFEPYCEWQKEEGTETLIIHLPDFKKDQLKVQVNNLGVLKVSGERPLEGKQRTRFLKEAKIPQGCDINDIRAKFMNGRLHVIMPKKAETALQVQEQKPASTSSSPPQEAKPKLEVAQEPKEEASIHNDQKQKASSVENGKTGTIGSDDKPKDDMFGIRSSLAKLGVDKKVAVGFGIGIVAVVAMGAYVALKCGSDASASASSSSSSTDIKGSGLN